MTVQDVSFLLIIAAALCAVYSPQARRGSRFCLWFAVVFLVSTCVYLRSAYAADTKISALTAVSAGVATHEFPVNESGTSKKITLDQIKTFVGGHTLFRLASDYTNNSTTGTEVTGIGPMTVSAAGTYHLDCRLIMRSAATTTSPKWGVNYTGTATSIVMHARFPSEGATAATGQIDDSANATTGHVWAYFGQRTESTTAPNLGPGTGVTTANVDFMVHVESLMVVSDTGDIELWAGSEVAASEIRIQAGSFCQVTTL